MTDHFLAAVPRQRLIPFVRQPARIIDQRVNHCLSVLASDLDQHDITRPALNQHRNLAVVAAEQ